MLWGITPAQIAFRQPSVFRRVTYELDVNPVQRIFTKDYLPQNYGSPELVPKRLNFIAFGEIGCRMGVPATRLVSFGLGALLIFSTRSRCFLKDGCQRVSILIVSARRVLIVLIQLQSDSISSAMLLAKAEGRNQQAI